MLAKGNFFFETEGYNPFFVDEDYIIASLKRNLPSLIKPGSISEIHFYGAGCYTERAIVIKDAMRTAFPAATCFLEEDILAAARALLGIGPGFAAILGTGTNTCIYDGKHITHNIDSLGFILGDEGSGGALGKKLIGDYIRGSLPGELKQAFIDAYQLTPNDLIDQIYGKPMANRFCASFSKFLNQHIQSGYAQKLVQDSFDELFRNLVTQYPDYKKYTFNCVGSIGYYFRELLTGSADRFGMEIGRIVQSPISELAHYHRSLHKS